jgi:hypothetical protein
MPNSFSIETDRGHVFLTAQHIQDAREWLADLDFPDIDPEAFDTMPDRKIINGVTRHFDGGWSGFLETY